VLETVQLISLGPAKIPDKQVRAWGHASEEVCKAFFDLLHSTIGELSSQKPGNFHIRPTGILIHELQRVRLYKPAVVVLSVKPFQHILNLRF
jgi:hypothetical protein